MKCIIAGSRRISHVGVIFGAIAESGFANEITEVVWGGAPGVDTVGKQWADFYGIPHKPMSPDWRDIHAPGAVIRYRRDGTPYNAKAGPDRNEKMAQYADALILIWDGKSDGSADMLRKAKAHGLRIYEHVVAG